MSLTALEQKIADRSATIGVIGLGYVGLAVACTFAGAGFSVLGVERRASRVDSINDGVSPILGDEPGLPELLRETTASGHLRAFTDAAVLSRADVILIAVETPVDSQSKKPHFAALESALRSLGPHLRRGALVIIESTIAPGTIAGIVTPVLEQASGLQVDVDFYLGHCPERVMPGRLLHNLRSMSRVCGGHTPETSQAMIRLYQSVVQADLDAADCITAEMVKTAENAYRDVQIAFANELAMICEATGADVWQVRDLVNKSPGRNVHLPGAGVGGHCIPKDPWLLVHAARRAGISPLLLPAARRINDRMPQHMADLVVAALGEFGRTIQQARVAVLGYAYLENSDDTRNTPSDPLCAYLRELGAEVHIHDPYIEEYCRPLAEVVANVDVIVVMVRHDAYRDLDLAVVRAQVRLPILIDGRRTFRPEAAQQAGFHFRSLGRG